MKGKRKKVLCYMMVFALAVVTMVQPASVRAEENTAATTEREGSLGAAEDAAEIAAESIAEALADDTEAIAETQETAEDVARIAAETEGATDDIRSDVKSEDVEDEQLSNYVPDGVIPKANWNDDQWDLYKRRVGQTLSGGYAYYIDIDGVPMQGKRLYYGGSGTNSNQTIENDYILAPQSELFPGCYIFDTETVKTNESFRIYEDGVTDVFGYLKPFRLVYDADDFTKRQVAVKHIYTLTFEQGEIDVKEFVKQLPKTEYYCEGQQYNSPSFERNDWSRSYDKSDFYAGAYCFSHWKDEEGKGYGNGYGYPDINKTAVLRPVYGNSQDTEMKNVDVLTVSNAQELLENITVVGRVETTDSSGNPGLKDNPRKILLISGDLMLDEQALSDFLSSEKVTAFLERNTLYQAKYDIGEIRDEYDSYFYWKNDMIVIPDGASLTIDNIRISEGSSGGIYGDQDTHMNLVVQDGGKLHLQNGANLSCGFDNRGIVIALQKGAQMTVTGAHAEIHQLDNHGTITLNKPANVAADDSMSWPYINVRGEFFNGKSGKIEANYGICRIYNGGNGHTYTSAAKKELRVPNVNSGLIHVTKEGALEISRSSGGSDKDYFLAIPFFNDGTIECDACPPEKFYGAPLKLEYSLLHNAPLGKIIVDQPAHAIKAEATMSGVSGYMASAGFQIYGAVLTNEGELDFTALDGCAARVDTQSPYYDPGSTGLCEEKIYAGIDNLEGGVIYAKSTADSIGYVNGEGCRLYNAGTITVTNTETAQKINNISLCSAGLLKNEGEIQNAGGIGYKFSTNLNLFGYEGNGSVKGSGTESFYYYLYAEDSNDESLPETVKVTVTVDGETVGTADGSSSFGCFLPMNQALDICMKAAGYTDGSSRVTTAADMAEYIGDGNYKRVYSYKIKMGSANTAGGQGSGGDNGEETDEEGGGTGNGGNQGGSAGGNTESGGQGGQTGGNTESGGGQTPATESAPVENKKPVADASGNMVTTTGKGEASVSQVSKTTKKSISVPAITTVNGVKYSVTTIEANAFQNASKATTVTLPNTITKIKAKAFTGSKIATVKLTIPKGKIAKLSVNKKAFQKSKVKKVQIIMSKADKKKKKDVIKKFTKAGIQEKNVKVTFK